MAKNNDTIVRSICTVLREKGWRLGVAESCTGGGIAMVITETPGVSDVFAGGVVAYSNEVKTQFLGVAKETLQKFGAVSAETSREMVAGLTMKWRLDSGIAVTGIAGPAGGTVEKPVGLVFISTYVGGEIITSENYFSPDRSNIRACAIETALKQLAGQLV